MPALRAAPHYRSMLFVPGHKRDWIEKAVDYGADALVLDLEDAVPPAEKASARATVRELLAPWGSRTDPALFVRANAWHTGQLLLDLDATVVRGLAGVLLPKTESP